MEATLATLARITAGRTPVLLPIWHDAAGSKTPAAKTIPVTVQVEDDAAFEPQLEYAGG